MISIPSLNTIWLIRYWLGGMFIYHSYGFFFEPDSRLEFIDYLQHSNIIMPELLGYIAKSIEFFGGILLLLNLFTRITSLLIFLVMSVAVFYMHKGQFWGEGELAFGYLLMAIILFFNPKIPFKVFNREPKTEEI